MEGETTIEADVFPPGDHVYCVPGDPEAVKVLLPPGQIPEGFALTLSVHCAFERRLKKRHAIIRKKYLFFILIVLVIGFVENSFTIYVNKISPTARPNFLQFYDSSFRWTKSPETLDSRVVRTINVF
jgi:hypothetical protein